jgi:hypothetical protein
LLPAGVALGAEERCLVEFSDHRDVVSKPPGDPNVRQAEILWMFLTPDGARSFVYNEHPRHVVFDGRDLPVKSPWWSPTPWDMLLPGDVLRIREPDGTLEQAGEYAICLVTGRPEQIEGVWGVKVEPLRFIDVLYKGRDGQHRVRSYSCSELEQA